MSPLISGSIAIFFYSASTYFLCKELKKTPIRKVSLSLAWCALLFHTVYNYAIFFHPNGIDFSFFNTASLILLIVVMLLLITALTKPVEKLGIALFPITSFMLFLSLTVPIKAQFLLAHSWPMNIHITSSIIAFSLLNIAAFQSLLLAIQENQLRKHSPLLLIQALPPLQTMESLLFKMIATGLVLLSISLLSGLFFIDDLFAQHLVHKTVLSIVAWVIFSALLFGRIRYGWRGKTAIRWTLSGFLLLLLAYFGSKLVIEIILHR